MYINSFNKFIVFWELESRLHANKLINNQNEKKFSFLFFNFMAKVKWVIFIKTCIYARDNMFLF